MAGRRNRTHIRRRKYRYTLPGDLSTVKLHAFMQGMLNAYHGKAQTHHNVSDDLYVTASSVIAAGMFEEFDGQGVQGTNDPELFRKTFVELCGLAHLATVSMLERTPATYARLDAMTEEARRRACIELAAKYLPQVESIPPSEQLVLEWLR